MRPLYFILKFVLNYSLRIYHKSYVRINAPKSFRTRTIFASNHASSFMDPLVIAVKQNPIVHFMTRADIYKGYVKAVFWAAQMIPIFRAQDGKDAAKKNDEVFDTCYREVNKGKGLILFAEGFTDDVFIRRLKPIKKGSLRIGFHICEKQNWIKKIYIQPMGINYTDPTKLRSSALVAYGNKICLNDYKDEYLKSPARTLVKLSENIEKHMQEQITHVENISWAPFHENVMRLTRKGMNNDCYDSSLSLKERWKYSRNLALWMNEQTENNENLVALKSKLENYFASLKKESIEENYIHEYAAKGKLSLTKQYLTLFFGFPFLLIGLLHNAPMYFWLKTLIEKSFKRRVFWSSVKMVAGLALSGFYNIIFIFLFYNFVYPSWWLALLYYFTVPCIGFLIMHAWLKSRKELPIKKACRNKKLHSFVAKRTSMIKEINEIIPVA